jgi:hypothetical protein
MMYIQSGLWSPIPNMLTMDHYICLYSIMVSSHQFHTWERDHSLCLYDSTFSSQQFLTWKKGPLCLYTTVYNWWEKTMVLYRQIEWSMISCMELVRRDHGVVYKDRVCLYNTMVSSHQLHTWDQGPLSVYTTPWSLLTSFIHETRDHSIWVVHGLMYESGEKRPWCIYRVVYGLMYETGEKRPWCCIDRVVYCLMYGICVKRPWNEFSFIFFWEVHFSISQLVKL